MTYPMNIVMTALLAVLGVGTGVHLGRSAIAEINPLYYSEPQAGASYAELSGYGRPREASPPAGEPEYAMAGLGTGCIGCRTYPEEYYPQTEPQVDGYAASARAPREELVPQYAVYEAGAYAQASDEVTAYSNYPVSEDEDPEEVEVVAAVTYSE